MMLQTPNSSFFGAVLKAVACTPNLNEDQAAYEAGVIHPSREIRRLEESLGAQPASEAQQQHVLDLLLLILETKRVDRMEQADRIREVLDRAQLHNLFGNYLQRVEASPH